MNILITGGTGLIGQRLTHLLDKGALNVGALTSTQLTITVLTRNKSQAASKLPRHIKVIDKLCQADVENQDIIINLAGEPIADKRWTKSQKQVICQSRWHITKQLTSLIKQAKNPPKLFISGSAIGIYGRQGNDPIDENFTQYHHEFTHDVCQQWEQLALEATTVTRVAILRTGVVLSNKGGALTKLLFPFKLGVGGKISTGRQIMSWIHIDDMISAMIHIINTPTLEGPINMTAEHAVSNEVFSNALAKALKRPCLFTTPAIVLTLIFGEMAELLLYGQRIIPKKLIESGFRFHYPTVDKALQHLVNQP